MTICRSSILIGLFIFCSCSALQRIKQEHKNALQLNQWSSRADSSVQDWYNRQTSMFSGNEHVGVELFPEGSFQYHPEQGFSGRARRLRINQQRQEISLTADSVHVRTNHRLQSGQYHRLRQQDQEQKQQVIKPYRAWYVYGAIVLLMAGFILGYGLSRRWRRQANR